MGLSKITVLSLLTLPLFLTPLIINGQETITGVVSSLSKPLPKVSVEIVGTSRGTATNENGYYQIEAENGQFIKFSHLGYESVEVFVDDIGGIFNLVLFEKVNQLEEVTVEKEISVNQGASPKDKPIKMETNFGTVDTRKAGYSIEYVSGEDLNLAAPSIAAAIANKFPSSGGRPNSSLYYECSPIWEVDGVIFTEVPLFVDIANVKEVFFLKSYAGTLKYGQIACGGVYIVKTHASEFKKSKATKKKDISTIINQNFNPIDVFTYAQYSSVEPYYFEVYNSLQSLAKAAENFSQAPNYLKNDPQYSITVAEKLFAQYGNNATSRKILEDTRNKNHNNAELLKAIAYVLQTYDTTNSAMPIYRKLLSLQPDLAQHYMNVAFSFTQNKNYPAAWNMYLKYLNDTPTETTEGIYEEIYEELQNLYIRHRKDLPSGASVKEFDLGQVQKDVRMIFEWNVDDAEFEMEFVNPYQQVFSFVNKNENSNQVPKIEKQNGSSLLSFYIDELHGAWDINFTYLGNSKHQPTYLKVITYFNWNKPEQWHQVSVYRFFRTGVKSKLLGLNTNSMTRNNIKKRNGSE